MSKSRSRSRSNSRETRDKKTKKDQAKIMNINKIITEDSGEDNEMEYKSFDNLTHEAVEELIKVPGLILSSRGVDDHNVEGIIMKPKSYASLITATQILEYGALIQIIPCYGEYSNDVRKYMFDVHQEYSNLTCK